MNRSQPDLEVLCAGAAVADTIVDVERFPDEDQRVIARSFHTGDGGPAATAAVAIARLGVPVGMCGTVGQDAAGDRILANLEAEGVDVRYMRRDRGLDSAQSVVIVSGGTAARTIVTTPALPPPVLPDDLPAWLHVDHLGLGSVTALGSARPLVSFDGGNPAEGLDLGVIDLYVPTVRALADRYGTGDAAALVGAALAEGAPAVVATAGAEGAWLGGSIVDRGRAAEPAAAPAVRNVPALPVDAVSTLGAGDVFHGALLAGVVQGKPLVEAVAAANICAGRSCRAMDGRSGIPDAAELDTLMAIHADALVGREDD